MRCLHANKVTYAKFVRNISFFSNGFVNNGAGLSFCQLSKTDAGQSSLTPCPHPYSYSVFSRLVAAKSGDPSWRRYSTIAGAGGFVIKTGILWTAPARFHSNDGIAWRA
jgi:hypothetical protein